MKLLELKLKSVDLLTSPEFSDLETSVFYTLMVDEPWIVYDTIATKPLKISSLIPTQKEISNTSVDNDNPIIVIERKGKLYIIDGHHRYARARRSKQDTIEACVIKLPDQKIDDLSWFEKYLKHKLQEKRSGVVIPV